MIDWDFDEIDKIDKHYRKVLKPGINFNYFCRHFEEIYRMSIDDELLIPDIFNDITYYTFNGINAKDKLLFVADKEKEVTEKLLAKRMAQRAQRQESRNRGMEYYYQFITGEVEEFVKKYPFWKELLRK